MRFKFLFFIMTLSFIVGCGNDNSSGSSSQKNQSNNIQAIANNLDNAQQSAYKNLLTWYNSKNENSTRVGTFYEQRYIQSTTPNLDCSQGTMLSGFVHYSLCGGSSSNHVENISKQVTFKTTQTKSLNSKLAAVFNTNSQLTLSKITEKSGGVGSIFALEFDRKDSFGNHTGYKLVYVIDTSLNSAVNPIEILDTQKESYEYLFNANSLR